MQRRDFLRRFGLGLAGLTVGAELDLERLLWVPKPIITVPAMPTDLRTCFRVGDVFTIEGRYAFHPVTMQRTAHLQQFIVTGNVHQNLVNARHA